MSQYDHLVDVVMTTYTDECVLWPYRTADFGHGDVYDRNRQNNIYASRAAFEIANEYLPPVVRHKCDNPPCINPRHLEGGTHADNVQDRVSRERSALGEHNGRSKLKELEVEEIFLSRENNAVLSRQYKVDRRIVRCIKSGKLWSSVTDPLRSSIEVIFS